MEDKVKMSLLLGYAKNHTGSKYQMLNIRTKRIVLSPEIIRKNFIECLLRKINTTSDTNVLQDEDESYNWAHI